MSGEQLSLAAAALPDAFVDAFRALEERADVARVSLVADEVLVVNGRWWLTLRARGQSYSLCDRASLTAAAADLFTWVHGRRAP